MLYAVASLRAFLIDNGLVPANYNCVFSQYEHRSGFVDEVNQGGPSRIREAKWTEEGGEDKGMDIVISIMWIGV